MNFYGGDSNFDWVFKPTEERSGGILSIWNKSIFSKTDEFVENGLLCVKGRWTTQISHVV